MPERQKPARKPQPRIRAGKACKRCNQKRIKCDAMYHTPCTNCVQNDNAECILRESRRGTYIRKTCRQNAAKRPTRAVNTAGYAHDSQEGPDAPTEAETDATISVHVPDAITTTIVPPTQIPVGSDDYQTANLRPRVGPSAPGTVPSNDNADPESAKVADGPPAASSEADRDVTHSSTSEEPRPVTDSPFQSSSVTSDSNASSYRDISWSSMFDHFINSRQDRREFVDKCSITYLGESFPLAIVLEDLNENGRPKLHYPGPPFPGMKQRPDTLDQLQPSHMMPEDLDFLRMKGVFELPEKAHLDAFFATFLERIYPLYPLVNRQELIQQHANGNVPLILLHSICFIAATFCDLPILHHAGFTSRRDARFHYYKKVKVLFDSGYEINKIVILQSAILMSFWGGGPNSYWNFYSWISTAVTIAEAVGIHRSTAMTNMAPQDRSLLRRLWWILVVRDSACSALVGRPFRIDIDQSDTEMLTIADFAHDAMVPNFLEASSHHKYAQYQIEIAKLSLILRDIVMSRFYPGRPPVPADELHARLNRWRDGLPITLTWQDEAVDHSNPFSMTLSVQYYHHLILIYLGRLPHNNLNDHENNDYTTTSFAAQHISTVACTAVTKSSILVMPHELFHGIFLAQAVFYTNMKSSNQLLARLGRSALTNCQMALHASCECWDPSPWIMQLFDNLSTRRLEEQSSGGEQNSYPLGPIDISGFTGGMGSTPDAGVFNGLLGGDPWQSNPMLSSLFDLPPEMLLPDQEVISH
ncbi:hypothetical protein N7510_005910 [Penicillium lagena]|uniref:uncharacterized protein n=1 Tax=Penicillium lagena TaxID=94218 RepID=UPI00254145B1|nr:uncharacterized protein N7510_005910 [Penicillium lagena]KAJ5612716.1 hypothetical protein N7510_005910 [Penicillium lagena]